MAKKKYKVKEASVKKVKSSEKTTVSSRYKNTSIIINGKKIKTEAYIKLWKEKHEYFKDKDSETMAEFLENFYGSEVSNAEKQLGIIAILKNDIITTKQTISEENIKRVRRLKFDEEGYIKGDFFKDFNDTMFVDEDEEIRLVRQELDEYQRDLEKATRDLSTFKDEVNLYQNNSLIKIEDSTVKKVISEKRKIISDIENSISKLKNSERFKKYGNGYIELNDSLLESLRIDDQQTIDKIYGKQTFDEDDDNSKEEKMLEKILGKSDVYFLADYFEKYRRLPTAPNKRTKFRSNGLNTFETLKTVGANGKPIIANFGKGAEVNAANNLVKSYKAKFSNLLTEGGRQFAKDNEKIGFNMSKMNIEHVSNIMKSLENNGDTVGYMIKNSLFSILEKTELEIKSVDIETLDYKNGLEKSKVKEKERAFSKYKGNVSAPRESKFIRPVIKNNFDKLLNTDKVVSKVRGAYRLKMMYDAIVAATVFHTLVSNTPEDDSYSYDKVVDKVSTKKTSVTYRNNFDTGALDFNGKKVYYTRGTVKDTEDLLLDVMGDMTHRKEVVTVHHEPDDDYIKGAWMMRFKNCTVRAFSTSVDSSQDYVFNRDDFSNSKEYDAIGDRQKIQKIAEVLYNLTLSSKDTDLFFELYNLDQEKFEVLEFGKYKGSSSPKEGEDRGRKHGVTGGYSWMAPAGFARMTKYYFSSLLNTGYSRNSLNALLKNNVTLNVSDAETAAGFSELGKRIDEKAHINVDSIFTIRGI